MDRTISGTVSPRQNDDDFLVKITNPRIGCRAKVRQSPADCSIELIH